jgi:hypothetical protein
MGCTKEPPGYDPTAYILDPGISSFLSFRLILSLVTETMFPGSFLLAVVVATNPPSDKPIRETEMIKLPYLRVNFSISSALAVIPSTEMGAMKALYYYRTIFDRENEE